MNSDPIRISVIMPAYNAADHITNAIESALAQTLPPFEVLVIDDGSKDDTAELVKAFGTRVRLLSQTNQGPAVARNYGAREARGDWFAFLDADDTWAGSKLEKQAMLAADPTVGIVQTLISGVYEQGIPEEIDFERLWSGNCVGTSAVMIRREAFEAAGGFPPDLPPVEDYYLWMKVAAAGWRIVTCQETLTLYTPAPQSLTRNEEKFARALLRCIERTGLEMQLPPDNVRQRILEGYAGHGRALIHLRQMDAARRFLRESFSRGFSAECLKLWLIAQLPQWILNLRRR